VKVRLSKILAQAGLTSRRGAEDFLREGRVTVNGVVRVEPGAQADPASDAITVDGRPLAAREPLAYVLLHKPRGYVTSLRDPEGRPLVVDPGERTTWLTVVLTEGRNREVRRYCQAMGHRVVRLKRVRFGPIPLGRLRAGASRPLTGAEVARLKRLHGGDRAPIMRQLPNR